MISFPRQPVGSHHYARPEKPQISPYRAAGMSGSYKPRSAGSDQRSHADAVIPACAPDRRERRSAAPSAVRQTASRPATCARALGVTRLKSQGRSAPLAVVHEAGPSMRARGVAHGVRRFPAIAWGSAPAWGHPWAMGQRAAAIAMGRAAPRRPMDGVTHERAPFRPVRETATVMACPSCSASRHAQRWWPAIWRHRRARTMGRCVRGERSAESWSTPRCMPDVASVSRLTSRLGRPGRTRLSGHAQRA